MVVGGAGSGGGICLKLCCVLFHIDRSISFLSFTFHLLPPPPPPPPLGVNLPVTRVIIKDQYGPWNPRLNTREWLKPSTIRQMWGRAGSKFGRKKFFALHARYCMWYAIREATGSYMYTRSKRTDASLPCSLLSLCSLCSARKWFHTLPDSSQCRMPETPTHHSPQHLHRLHVGVAGGRLHFDR